MRNEVLINNIVGKRGLHPVKRSKAAMAFSTSHSLEILRSKTNLMEEILLRDNMMAALKKVCQNKGCPGVDGMSVSELSTYLKKEWPRIKDYLLQGQYKPMSIKRMKIPKQGGGSRTLGIPTVLDRLIQQSLLQILQRYIDSSFSKDSFGFRPKKSAHMAVERARGIIKGGKGVMIDLDIEKFFDRVNHDRLMSKLFSMIKDQRILDLIRRYLNSGLSYQGVPQGGPLSPLISNIYLDDLDKELTRRKLSFVRYADDILIFVKTEREANGVMIGIKKYLCTKLKLKINETKSGIGKSAKFLGFYITKRSLCVDKESVKAFKNKIREHTKICGGKSMWQIFRELKPIIRGWGNYFAPQILKTTFIMLNGWIRRRIRACYYRQLKNGKARLAAFIAAGIGYDRAYRYAYSSRGKWHASQSDVMREVLNNKRLKGMGLISLER